MPPPPITTTLGKTWSKLEASATPLLPNSALMPTTPIASTPSSTLLTITSSAAPISAPSIMTVSGQTPGTPSGSNGGTPTGTPGGLPLGVSRRTHPKSRTGCRTCKIRKIKCDEERPSCRNCIKHGVKCPYTTPPSTANTPISTTASPIPLNSMLQPGLATPFTLHGDHDLNLVDLELLHNFTTATYATLSIDSLVRDVWRINVVRLGVQCDYVMRTILAVSALHMAHHRPEKRDFYFSRALTYHQMASQTATPLLSNLATSSEGWESLYIFSTLTIFFSLGSTKQPDMIHGESFPPWIYLLSGARSLVQLAWLRLDEYQGPLAPLFRHGRRRWELYHSLEHTVPISPELQELQERIIRTVADPHTRNIYLAATDDLARNIRVSSMAGMDCMPDITDAFVWVFADMDPFLAMLRAPTQESVAILAHFSVMIRQMENQWWLEGWSSLLLAKAWDVLDDEHKLWIQWPMEQVGWIPP